MPKSVSRSLLEKLLADPRYRASTLARLALLEKRRPTYQPDRDYIPTFSGEDPADSPTDFIIDLLKTCKCFADAILCTEFCLKGPAKTWSLLQQWPRQTRFPYFAWQLIERFPHTPAPITEPQPIKMQEAEDQSSSTSVSPISSTSSTSDSQDSEPDCEDNKENITPLASTQKSSPLFGITPQPYIPVKIGEKSMLAMLNTGADGNFISASVVKHWEPTELQMVPLAAEGSEMHILGIVSLPMQIRGVTELTEFYVAQGLCRNLILGCPWMRKQRARLDFARKCIHLGRKQRLTIYW